MGLILDKRGQTVSISVEEIRRLLKSVCKPVAMPPEFKKRLLERLVLEAIKKRLLDLMRD